MTTLFDTEEKPVVKRIDLWNIYLIEKHGLSPEWNWHGVSSASDVVPEGFLRITGAVPTSYKPSGRPVWGKGSKATTKTFFLNVAEFDSWKVEWENRTGICSTCLGRGKTFTSFSTDTTTGDTTVTYQPCVRGCEVVGELQEIKRKDGAE